MAGGRRDGGECEIVEGRSESGAGGTEGCGRDSVDGSGSVGVAVDREQYALRMDQLAKLLGSQPGGETKAGFHLRLAASALWRVLYRLGRLRLRNLGPVVAEDHPIASKGK